MNLTPFYDFGAFEFKKKIWIRISDKPAKPEHVKVIIKKIDIYNENFCMISCDINCSYLNSEKIIKIIKKSEIRMITEGILNKMVNKWFKRARPASLSKIVVFYFLNRRIRGQRFEFDYSIKSSNHISQIEVRSDTSYKHITVLYPVLRNRIFLTKNPIYNYDAFFLDVIRRTDPLKQVEKIIFEMDGNKYQMKKDFTIITKQV